MKPRECPECHASLTFDADAEILYCAVCEGVASAIAYGYDAADEADLRDHVARDEGEVSW